MRELTSAGWIKAKGILFLCLGVLSSVLLWLDHPTLRTALLLAIAIWSFCRFYYFAFYVMDRYVDPSYRFSGLIALVGYVTRRRSNRKPTADSRQP